MRCADRTGCKRRCSRWPSSKTSYPPITRCAPIRLLVNEAPSRLNGLFNLIYADSGRASIAPEKLLRAMLVQDRDRASIGLGAVQSFQAVDADSLVALPGDTTGAPSYPSGKPVLTTGLPDGYGPAAVSVQQSTPARTRLG